MILELKNPSQVNFPNIFLEVEEPALLCFNSLVGWHSVLVVISSGNAHLMRGLVDTLWFAETKEMERVWCTLEVYILSFFLAIHSYQYLEALAKAAEIIFNTLCLDRSQSTCINFEICTFQHRVIPLRTQTRDCLIFYTVLSFFLAIHFYQNPSDC